MGYAWSGRHFKDFKRICKPHFKSPVTFNRQSLISSSSLKTNLIQFQFNFAHIKLIKNPDMMLMFHLNLWPFFVIFIGGENAWKWGGLKSSVSFMQFSWHKKLMLSFADSSNWMSFQLHINHTAQIYFYQKFTV